MTCQGHSVVQAASATGRRLPGRETNVTSVTPETAWPTYRTNVYDGTRETTTLIINSSPHSAAPPLAVPGPLLAVSY